MLPETHRRLWDTQNTSTTTHVNPILAPGPSSSKGGYRYSPDKSLSSSLCTAAPPLKKKSFFWGEGRLYTGYYPVDSTIAFPDIYPLDSDLSRWIALSSFWTTGAWTRIQFNTGIKLLQVSSSLLCVLVPDPLLLLLLTNDTLVANGVDDPLQATELRPVVSFTVKRYYTFVGHKSWKNGIPNWSCAGQKNEGLWVNADRKNERDAWRVPRTATRISGLETIRGNKKINFRNKKDYSYRFCFKG